MLLSRRTSCFRSSILERYFATLLSSPPRALFCEGRVVKAPVASNQLSSELTSRALFCAAAVVAASSAISRRCCRRHLECGLFFWVDLLCLLGLICSASVALCLERGASRLGFLFSASSIHYGGETVLWQLSLLGTTSLSKHTLSEGRSILWRQ